MIIIAGPCSVETEDQVMETAEFLSKRNDVDFMRAGVWKPRSSGNEFEGVGEIGLQWLEEAKRRFGIRIGTEVGNAKHVELALKWGVDMMWIGARSTVNPFYVDEIAEALRGSDVKVMVKNPVSPDLKLWIGAIERFERVGIVGVSAVHRGFSTFGGKIYRNSPLWEIPIELKRIRNDVNVITDPSHIAGSTLLINKLVRTALNYQMDGIMVEVHPNPTKAWTDRSQQLSFVEFSNLISDSIHDFRMPGGVSPIIERLRCEIDDIDDKIIELLSERVKVSRRIGDVKKTESMPILQLDRWDYLLRDRMAKGLQLGLSEEFVKSLFDIIHIESLKTQDDLTDDM